MSVGEQEVMREARRVLRKLASGKRLVACDAARFAVTGTGAMRNAMKVERRTVEAFAARDWLKGSAENGFALSDVGLGWLKRAECEGASPFAAQQKRPPLDVDIAGEGWRSFAQRLIGFRNQALLEPSTGTSMRFCVHRKKHEP